MQLVETVKRQLQTDQTFLTSMLSRQGVVDATVVLEEEPGEVVITLLMTDLQIKKAIQQAVEEFFEVNYVVSNIYMCCGKRLITFTISKKNC